MTIYDELRDRFRDFAIRQDQFETAVNEFAARLLSRLRVFLGSPDGVVNRTWQILTVDDQFDDGFFEIAVQIVFPLPGPEIQYISSTPIFRFKPTRDGTQVDVLERNRVVEPNYFLITENDADFEKLFKSSITLIETVLKFDPFAAKEKLSPGFDISYVE